MRLASVFLFVSFFFFTPSPWEQHLGPHFKKIKEGIFVRTAKPTDSHAAIILMHQSVVPIALLEVVPRSSGDMVKQGKSLEEIKKEFAHAGIRRLGRQRAFPQPYRGGLPGSKAG